MKTNPTLPAISNGKDAAKDLATPKAKPRLLVVDDQATNIQVLYQILSDDYQVLMATSGAQALLVCTSKRPDLILLDLVMPEMDGVQVCQRLKADSSTRDIPIIFVSAQTDAAVEEMGFDLGAVDFISKPINPRTVRARVKTHLMLKAQSDLLRNWAHLDGLTGVHNQRFFQERINAEMGRANRNATSLSVIMLDLDFFTRFNERYGHESGDHCLRLIADTLKKMLMRSGDHIARGADDEFYCVLPDTGLSGALQLAEEIKNKIIALQIEHADSSVAPFVTVSAGVASKPDKIASKATDLLNMAEAQLRSAKELGRHRIYGAEIVGEN